MHVLLRLLCFQNKSRHFYPLSFFWVVHGEYALRGIDNNNAVFHFFSLFRKERGQSKALKIFCLPIIKFFSGRVQIEIAPSFKTNK